MLNFLKTPKILFEELKNEGTSGGSGYTPEKTEPKEEPPAKEDTPPAQSAGDQLDDFGYAITKPEAPKPDDKEAPKTPTKEESKEPEKIADPATGYGDEPPKVEDAPKTPDPATPPPVADDIDKALSGLVPTEASKIKDFVTKHKVSPEVTKAFADMRKAEMEEAKTWASNQTKEAEKAMLKEKAAWHNELKTDPVFGGEKFAKNVHNVEKVMSDFMPNLKKTLTERKAMLPPYLMRDLAKLADHLYSTEGLVTGDPKATENASSDKEDDGTAFYR